MDCLFVCFRARDDQSTSDSVSQLSGVKSKSGNDSKNRLSDLFLSEEKAASSLRHDRDGSGLDSMHIEKDLKDEAQFLKPLSTTPIEIRKASEKLETPQRGRHFAPSQSHSWITSKSEKAVFHLDEKTDEHCQELPEQSPSSCLTDARNSARIFTGFSGSGEDSQESIGTAFRDVMDKNGKMPLTAGNITGKKKSVRFEFDFDQTYSSSSSKDITSRKHEKAGRTNFSETTNMESEVMERQRNMSQFVHTASNLKENSSICKLREDSDKNLKQAKVQACKEKTGTESPTSTTSEEKLEQSSDQKHQIDISPSVNKNMAALYITHEDRPIIGMVAAHWNEEEKSHTSPKWWDGNGIPNSTNKYKEDQKVNWHATSFEERLEKALSEEGSQSFISSRKFGIMEETERDTAISQLQHSAQFKSVVSF